MSTRQDFDDDVVGLARSEPARLDASRQSALDGEGTRFRSQEYSAGRGHLETNPGRRPWRDNYRSNRLFVREDGPENLSVKATRRLKRPPTPFLRQRNTLAVPSVRFTNRPRLRSRGTDGISRFSRLEFPYMHQVFDSAVLASCLPSNARSILPSTTCTVSAHGTKRFTELNTGPACTPAVATPVMLPPPAYDSGPACRARTSL